MPGLVLSAASGWLLASLFAAASLLPWAVRRSTNGPFRWHFLLGYSIAPLAILHSWPGMSEGWAMGVAPLGLYAAMLALLLAFVQAGLGLQLREAGTGRRRLRRAHFAGMAVLSGLLATHIVLNSALVAWARS